MTGIARNSEPYCSGFTQPKISLLHASFVQLAGCTDILFVCRENKHGEQRRVVKRPDALQTPPFIYPLSSFGLPYKSTEPMLSLHPSFFLYSLRFPFLLSYSPFTHFILELKQQGKYFLRTKFFHIPYSQFEYKQYSKFIVVRGKPVRPSTSFPKSGTVRRRSAASPLGGCMWGGAPFTGGEKARQVLYKGSASDGQNYPAKTTNRMDKRLITITHCHRTLLMRLIAACIRQWLIILNS